jgi:hypothetical protein
VNNEIQELQTELKRENANLKDTLQKTEIKMRYSMMCSTFWNLPNHLSMLSFFVFFFSCIHRCRSLVENSWNQCDAYSISKNVAMLLKPNDKVHLWCVEGAHTCSTFTVLLNASFYEVGFVDSKGRQWAFSSGNVLRLFSSENSLNYATLPIPNLPLGTQGDIFVVSRVGKVIEFERNGRKLDVFFEDSLRNVSGLEIESYHDNFFPIVFLREKGDTVTMLDYQSYRK